VVKKNIAEVRTIYVGNMPLYPGNFSKISLQKATIYEKNLKHIFRSAEGHLSDTALNRRLLINTASSPKNYLGKDRFGNIWHAEIQKDGTQIWTVSRNGQVRNGGINQHPRNFNQITGLSKENL
jgi:hypothetical protein